MIKVDLLSRKYNDHLAVNSVSFDINKGEIVGLLGHNGAGKTTIMKMLTGYLEPSAGHVLIDGQNILQHRQEAQSKIGYLPENCPLYPEMNVVSYLEYVAKLRGMTEEKQRMRAIASAIRRTELKDHALRNIATLSRGYRQRVGVAQAILGHPKILILDEPTNGLDPSQIHHMRSLIQDLAKNCTVIVSTHILQEVQAICDRVLILGRGRLGLDAKLSDLQQSNRVLVSINAPPERALGALRVMEGVKQAEFLYPEGRQFFYALQMDASSDAWSYEDLAPSLIQSILRHGHQLYSIGPEKRDLEVIFREINTLTAPGGL